MSRLGLAYPTINSTIHAIVTVEAVSELPTTIPMEVILPQNSAYTRLPTVPDTTVQITLCTVDASI